jgi:hypothetical protein
MPLFVGLQNIRNDFLDRSALSKPSTSSSLERVDALIVLVCGASGVAEAMAKLVTQLIGETASVVSLLLLVLGCARCFAIVRDKEYTESSSDLLIIRPVGQIYYKYGPHLRKLAKSGFLLLLICIPIAAYRASHTYLPLPSTIYGRVTDKNDHPLDSLTVSVESRGLDMGSRDKLPTDSIGRFLVKTRGRVNRTASFRISGCVGKDDLIVPIASMKEESAIDRRSGKKLSPFFSVQIDCVVEEKQ